MQRTDSGELTLDLRYEYAPTAGIGGARTDAAKRDGVAVQVPILFLNQLNPEPFRWQIPACATNSSPRSSNRSLAIRRNFVPAPDVARAACAALEEDYSPATDARCSPPLRSYYAACAASLSSPKPSTGTPCPNT